MRKVICGRMFDTETAKRLGEWNSEKKGILVYDRAYSNDAGGAGYWEEAVYQKKTGEYFLYTKSYIDQDTDGHLERLTEADAKNILMQMLDGDQYEAIFGKVKE